MRRLLARSAAFLVLPWIAIAAQAQSLSISAEVDRNVVSLNEQIALSVTVSGDQTSVPDPHLPSMPDFSVYSSGRRQNISFVNGKISSSVTYDYTLVPRFPGKVAIGPISVEAGGKTVSTNPIEIQVVRQGQSAQPSASPPPNRPQAGAPVPRPEADAPPVFVTASLDKSKAYVNEQVTLTVRFYTSVPLLGNPQYEPPSLQGFLAQDLPPERHGQIASHGRNYFFSEIKTALFPVQPGRLTVGTAKVVAQVQTDMAVDPFSPDFFQQFFSQNMASRSRELRTAPVALQVLSLPQEGKPASFSGAVGRFRASAQVDRANVKVGEAVTLTWTVEGQGNLDALAAPKLPDLPSFRVYDTVGSLNINKTNDVVHGSKTFKTVLVPRVTGPLTLPSIPFSYFDPIVSKYLRADTAPARIQSAPGGPAVPAVGFVSAAGASPNLTTLAEDIRYVHESGRVSGLSAFLAAIGRATWPHWIPLVIFLACLGTNRYREWINLDPVGRRFRSALAKTRRQIRAARSASGAQPSRCAELLSEALTGYLADKLNGSAYGLTLRDAQSMVHARFPGVTEGTMAKLKSVWEDLERARFAGTAATDADLNALAAGMDDFLATMEREMRR